MSPPRDGEDSPGDGPDDNHSQDVPPSDHDDTNRVSPADGDDTNRPTPIGDDSTRGDGPLDPDNSATARADENPPREPDGDGGVAPNGSGRSVDAPAARRAEPDREGDGSALQTFVVDVLSSAIAVLLVGVLLFAVSGVWPPMVAVESPSMTPHMKTGDLVFVMEEQRFPGDGAIAGTGVVTAQTGERTEYRKFAKTGDVIVYEPDGRQDRTPIIHRAMFWVNESENWYEKADKQSIGRYSECGETTDEALPNCPAPHAGFVTKGDANGVYDQAQGLSSPVKPAWVVGTAEVRIPKLGCIRLRSEGCTNGMLGFSGPSASATTFERSCLCNRTVERAAP
ncbi:S26 family signal peptidase [Halosimplex amylolyticum]|uniref:S26 family signal peptidase n=1 Tax=Halosimplex amylolyticum TaxID=3396616 RepID=UPI003F55228A